MKKVIGIIPARYGSSRFPGKPLALINGKPMIQYVYEGVKESAQLAAVYVATDDIRIYDTVLGFGGECILTSECNCGSERVYEAVKNLDCDIVMNIQGDEPLIRPSVIQELLMGFEDDTVIMATLKKRIGSKQELEDPNVVKVITDREDNAIYFSRYCLPYNRNAISDVVWYKHIGLYGYKKEFLEQYIQLPISVLERAESLEQLRVIENGFKIRVLETNYETAGVDLPEHIKKIERILSEEEKVRCRRDSH